MYFLYSILRTVRKLQIFFSFFTSEKKDSFAVKVRHASFPQLFSSVSNTLFIFTKGYCYGFVL